MRYPLVSLHCAQSWGYMDGNGLVYLRFSFSLKFLAFFSAGRHGRSRRDEITTNYLIGQHYTLAGMPTFPSRFFSLYFVYRVVSVDAIGMAQKWSLEVLIHNGSQSHVQSLIWSLLLNSFLCLIGPPYASLRPPCGPFRVK